ncbi:UNVERIFIED_CONTAM: hypothetical protein Sradi_2978100 [Sesamum radiatum]|uniref:Reverse transcriptase domain-containing protein n=1 Tax=Sesamum radiatum TaxID=300843 RepID=A0AAW2S0G7_SESRA
MAKPVKQKKRSFGVEQNLIIEEEVNEILEAGYMSKVQLTKRLVNKMFKDHIGISMEVYVADMLVKNKRKDDHLTHLKQAFELMRTYRMKLNLTKCTFRIQGRKFQGYMVSERGTEENFEKIEAIMQLLSPTTLKEVQKLIGKIASLSRFISRSADWNLEH